MIRLNGVVAALSVVIVITGCGDSGGGDEVKVETFNLALAGAFIPFEAERREPLYEAIPTSDADILCLQEVWDQTDKEAIRDAAASEFPHVVIIEEDLDTPIDSPTDQNGVVPAMPTGVPCPDVDVGENNIQDQLDQATQCIADNCSTTGDATGRTTSAACAAAECVDQVVGLLFGNAMQQRCYASAITQLPTEVIEVLNRRSKTIVNQDLAFRGQNGVMILSRHPLSNPRSFVLPGTWNRRTVVSATAALPNGNELDIYCNHLTPIFDDFTFPYTGQYGNDAPTEAEQWEAEQHLQAEKLVDYAQEKSGERPAVIMGDLNAGREYQSGGETVLFAEGAPTLDVLESVFTPGVAADYTPQCTFCDSAVNPLNDPETLPVWIDHILLYKFGEEPVVSTARTFDESVVPVDGGTVPLSDHFGVASVLTMP